MACRCCGMTRWVLLPADNTDDPTKLSADCLHLWLPAACCSVRKEPLGRSPSRGYKLPEGMGISIPCGRPQNVRVRLCDYYNSVCRKLGRAPISHNTGSSVQHTQWAFMTHNGVVPSPPPCCLHVCHTIMRHDALQAQESANSTQTVIFPDQPQHGKEEDALSHKMYLTSHHSFEPGASILLIKTACRYVHKVGSDPPLDTLAALCALAPVCLHLQASKSTERTTGPQQTLTQQPTALAWWTSEDSSAA